MSIQKITGLTASQILENRRKFGTNVESERDFTTLKLIVKTVFSIFNILMIVLILVLILVDQRSTARFIGIVAAINTVIELIQEIRARLIIKKLKAINQKTVRVVRGGTEQEIPISELVVNDVIILKSGDRVVADGQLLASAYAEFDESILTGESKYIEKKPGEEIKAGSFIVAGSCYYTATKLLKDSYVQAVTQQVAKHEISPSPLQSQIDLIIKALTYMTLFFIVLLVAEGLVQQNERQEIIINTSVLVSSLVPQGLVLITTISFAYGAIHIARNQAIVQRLSAIEAMANTKVVCMDKTGTLTKNQLEVKEITIV